MAAQRADASAGLADVAAHQEQIGDLLDILGAVAMLGDAHAVAEDHALGLDIDRRHALDRGAGEARSALDRLPARRLDVGLQRLEAIGMLCDEGAILGTGGEHRLHHALQHRGVAADLHQMIFGGERGRVARDEHLDRVLG